MKTAFTKAVYALAIVVMILFLLLQEATACPSNLKCSNFTSEKRPDCNYIWGQTAGQERREAVCILWDQEYGFPGYNHSIYPNAQANFTFSPKEIETSRFILFFKVLIFVLFNYILFSILTKTSFMRKCLAVD